MNPDTMAIVSQLVVPAISAIVGGAAVYAAIKSDLADLRARIVRLEMSDSRAHDRIDDLLRSRSNTL